MDTNTQLQAMPPGRIVALSDGPELTREQVDLLKRTIAKGTTDDEFKLFLEACRRRRFDPFSKLIYPVKRWDSKERREVMALQSSIDSFRLVAERTGKYAGQLGPFWCGGDGKWVDVWLSEEAPRASRVGVLRSDFKEPLWGVALWSNYVQTTKTGDVTQFWSRMGPLMLAKCAESVALRRAFPEDLAGLYTSDEMAQAESEPQAQPPRTLPQAAAQAQAKAEPRTVHAEIVQPAKAEAVYEPIFPDAGTDDPHPADVEPTMPMLEPVDERNVRYEGVYIPNSVIDTWAIKGKNDWSRLTIESKAPNINGQTWEWVVGGGPPKMVNGNIVLGGRESWLRACVRVGLEDQKGGKAARMTAIRGAYCLYLMKCRHFEEFKESKELDTFFEGGTQPATEDVSSV